MQAPTLAEECGAVVRSSFDRQTALSMVRAQPGSCSETELASKAYICQGSCRLDKLGGKETHEKGGKEIKVWKKQRKVRTGVRNEGSKEIIFPEKLNILMRRKSQLEVFRGLFQSA
jgi:hypothetical protein